MKKTLCFLIATFAAIVISYAAKIPSTANKEINISQSPQASMAVQQTVATSGYTFSEFTLRDFQKSLGRKLSFKEKVSWYLFKKQFKPEGPPEVLIRKANTNAVLGFAFSLAGIIIFPLFLIPALILSLSALRAEQVDPGILRGANYGLAMAGKIISYIGIGLIVLTIAIVLAYVLYG